MSNKDIKNLAKKSISTKKSISGQCYISSPLKTWENFGFSDVFRGYKKHSPEMGQICQICSKLKIVPVGIYLLKANDRNTRTRSEICSKLTLKTPKRRHWLVNFGYISHPVSMLLLLTLNMYLSTGLSLPLALNTFGILI